MQSLIRPLKHAKAGFVPSRPLTLVQHLTVSGLDCLRQPHHIQQVQQLLRQQGLLKLSLGFPDDESRYLHGLIVGLAELHGHGLPVDHSASQGWFWDIRPSATQFQSNGSRARSETMEEFPWHTDCSYEASPPRYFALQVLQPDRRGGGVFSALGVDNILRHLSHVSRAALCCPNYRITVPPEFVRPSGKRHIVGSILAVADDNRGRPIATLRFREDIITPLTTEAAVAVKELKQVLMSAEAQRDTLHFTPEDMPRGSILLLNNRRWLHARNEVMDPERHLRRVRWDATSFP